MTRPRRRSAQALLIGADPIAPELAEFLRDARRRGVPIGLCSTVDGELGVSLVDDLAEPRRLAREYFAVACLALRTPPPLVLYVDSDDRAVSAARVAGLSAYRWSGPADLSYLRAAVERSGNG